MIYFIKQIDDNIIKIGYTDNIKHRLTNMQTANGHPLEVILLIEGDYKKESEIHSLFSEFRSKNEWYFLSDEIKNFINSQQNNNLMFNHSIINNVQCTIQTKFIRQQNKLTLKDVGLKLGITPQSVKEIETRELNGTITINTLNNYANVLGYKLEYKFVKSD
jgi:DNA-binding XRE family transcriptional regulator